MSRGAGEGMTGMVRVGLTGGIGSGKSTVARAFEVLGARVYYADVRARELMNTDLVGEITSLLGSEAYLGGVLDRKYVASRVFADASLLSALNAIVHPRVARDWEEFCAHSCHPETSTPPPCHPEASFSEPRDLLILESAILFESGFAGLVDRVITVETPLEERVERVMARDGVAREAVEARIRAQMSDSERAEKADYRIKNGERDEVLPRILELYNEL